MTPAASSNLEFPFFFDPSVADFSFVYDELNAIQTKPLALDLEAWKLIILSIEKFQKSRGNIRTMVLFTKVAEAALESLFPEKIHRSELSFGFDEEDDKNKEERATDDVVRKIVSSELKLCVLSKLCRMYWNRDDQKEMKTACKAFAQRTLRKCFPGKLYPEL